MSNNGTEYRKLPPTGGMIAYEKASHDRKSALELSLRDDLRDLERRLNIAEADRDRFRSENARVMGVLGHVGSLRKVDDQVEVTAVADPQHVDRLRIGLDIWIQTGTNDSSTAPDVSAVATLGRMLATKEAELRQALKERDDARTEANIARTDADAAQAQLVQGVLEVERLKIEVENLAHPPTSTDVEPVGESKS